MKVKILVLNLSSTKNKMNYGHTILLLCSEIRLDIIWN